MAHLLPWRRRRAERTHAVPNAMANITALSRTNKSITQEFMSVSSFFGFGEG
jgi:hypothetical protein